MVQTCEEMLPLIPNHVLSNDTVVDLTEHEAEAAAAATATASRHQSDIISQRDSCASYTTARLE